MSDEALDRRVPIFRGIIYSLRETSYKRRDFRVAIILTDGRSQDNVTGPAEAARKLKINTFAIGEKSSYFLQY